MDGALSDFARVAFATGDRAESRHALDLLADRKWSGVRALRAEFAAAPVEPPMVSHRVVAGRSLLLRPRDLTFGLISQIVEADLSRRAQKPPSTQPQAAR